MFKKSKRNFRSNRTEIDSGEEENVSVNTVVSNSVSQHSDSAPKSKPESTILSFQEEEEVVEFKIKKSKESRRIAKELKKTKKDKNKNDNNEQNNGITVKNEEISSEIFFNEEIRVKPLKKNEKNLSKYLTNKYANDEVKSEDEFNSYNLDSDEDLKPNQLKESDKLKVFFQKKKN